MTVRSKLKWIVAEWWFLSSWSSVGWDAVNGANPGCELVVADAGGVASCKGCKVLIQA